MKLILQLSYYRLCKLFANQSLTNMKLSKTKISKIVQSKGFFGKLLRRLIKISLPLAKM